MDGWGCNNKPITMLLNNKLINHIYLLLLLCVVQSAFAELEYYPGFHRSEPRPPPAKWGYQDVESSEDVALQELASFLEAAHHRLRIIPMGVEAASEDLRIPHHGLQEAQSHVHHSLHDGKDHPQRHDTQSVTRFEPDFTYSFPLLGGVAIGASPEHQATPFAVGPSDPRYYEPINLDLDSYERATQKQEKEENDAPSVGRKADEFTASPDSHQASARSGHGAGPMGAVGYAGLAESSVIRRPVDREGATPAGMYMVALVAGISAAATVALVALGLGWYTLQKKSKAAADVEYPAYGVTGPHKDSSPAPSGPTGGGNVGGDRRLAQSAQMYHYQHQKQQIIAMEKTGAVSGGPGSLSEAESEDENDEGDYTVYECPGLAPTGEMEVKNPLFLDDPTPATPAAILSPSVSRDSAATEPAGKP